MGSGRDFFGGEILKSIRAGIGSAIIGFVAQALVDHIPLVFLKQARSVESAEKASYQKIVEAPLKIRDYYAGSRFTQSYKLTISPLDSHPLAQRLGLQPEQTNLLGAWLKVDFILGLGTEF